MQMQPSRPPSPEIGATVFCAETGRPFVIARDGCSFNCATNQAGEIISDEGVDIRERREMSHRHTPFACYVSTRGDRVTGWKGNTLGHVLRSSLIRNPFGGHQIAVTVRDVHGGYWHGRGAGRGMSILLHPSKREPRL